MCLRDVESRDMRGSGNIQSERMRARGYITYGNLQSQLVSEVCGSPGRRVVAVNGQFQTSRDVMDMALQSVPIR